MNFSMFRIIRNVDRTPTKEVLKEFLRFIGCIVSDHPVQSAQEAEAIMADTKDAVDILLGFACIDMQNAPVQEIPRRRAGRALIVNRSMPDGVEKRNCYALLTDTLIDTVWTDQYAPDGAGTARRNQLHRLSDIFFRHHLFGYFLSKRSLRIIDMPEVYGSRFRFGELRQKILADRGSGETGPYIHRMLKAFADAYKDLCAIPEPGVYARYARINIARKIREVHDSFVVAGSYPVPGAEALLKDLDDLYDLDRSYMGTIFLAAAVCKSDPALFLTSSNYLRLLLDTIQDREGELYSFAYYEYGRQLERVYQDWEHAVAYYRRAAKLWKYNYQAQFKLGCYEAQYNGDYPKAIEIFQDLRAMIAQVYSGGEGVNYANLSLKAIQYLFKTDIWIWILSKELDRGITAEISLTLADQDVSNYKENACVRRAYDEDDPVLQDLQVYHERSLPVQLMEATVRKASAQEPAEG